MQNGLKHELHNILSGKGKVRFGTIIQTIACYLNDGEKTSTNSSDEKHFKKQEAKKLEDYITEKKLQGLEDLMR